MSDHIPFEIQTEIMKYLPVKSLIQFRSVSKQWNSFITSSEFIADYHVGNTHPPEHLFVRYFDEKSCERKHVSFVNDDTFPVNKFSLTVPLFVTKLFDRVNVSGSSNGLFCLYDIYRHKTAVIWNPTIRKSVDIDLGIVFDSPYKTFIGFGVTPHTLDPIIVKVTCLYFNYDYEDDYIDDINYVPWRVEVFKISSGVWRSPLCNNLPRESIQLTGSVVDINGYIYFLAFEWIVINHCLCRSYLIISFDMKTEEFTELRLPNCFEYKIGSALLFLSKLKEYVVVFALRYDEDGKLHAWMIENDVQRSATKFFSVKPPNATITKVFGFRKSSECIMEVLTGLKEKRRLFVYEPFSKQITYVRICGKMFISFARSYVESLLLVNN